MRVQEVVAFAAREPLVGEDPLGEGADLIEMRAFLLRRGVVPLEADRITSAFASYPTDGEKLMTWEQREAKLLEKKRRSVSSPRKAVNDDKQILLAPTKAAKLQCRSRKQP